MNHRAEEISQLIAVGLYKQPAPRALAYLGSDRTYIQLSPNISMKNLFITRKLVKNKRSATDFDILITPTSQILLPILSIALLKSRLILDLGWPMSDQAGTKQNIRIFIYKLKIYFLDLVAIQLSDLVIVESNAQVRRVRRKFLVSKKKIKRVYTSLDESKWKVTPKPIVIVEKLLKESRKIVLFFRGKYNNESGIERILELASNLEEKFQVIIATNKLPHGLLIPSNTIVLEQFLEYSELTYLYSISDVCLGQLSTDKRLAFTLPHKYSESGYFGKPYLSFESPPLQEEGPNHGLIAIKNISDLSEVLSQETKSTLSAKGKRNRDYYEQHLSQKVVMADMAELFNRVI